MPRLTSTQKRKLDTICAQQKKALGHCERCYRQPPVVQLQWAHLHTRRILATRWHRDNSFVLCAGCHLYTTQHPTEFIKWVQTVRTPEQLDALMELTNRLPKVDYQTVLAELASWSTPEAP